MALAAAAAVVVVGAAVEWKAMRGAEAPVTDRVVAAAAPPPVSVAVEPVTADDFIARGFLRLVRDANGAFLDFAEAFRRRADGRTVALMGYARTRSHSSSGALEFYSEAIDRFGYRQAWVLNNRAYERIHAHPNDPTEVARAAEDVQAALTVAPDLVAAKYNRARAVFSRIWTRDDYGSTTNAFSTWSNKTCPRSKTDTRTS